MLDAGHTYWACHFLIMLERNLSKVASGQNGEYMIPFAAGTCILVLDDVPLIRIS